MRVLLLCQKFRVKEYFIHSFIREYILDRVFSTNDFFEKLSLHNYDLIVIDACQANYCVKEIIAELGNEKLATPIIVLTQDWQGQNLNLFLRSQISAIIYLNSSKIKKETAHQKVQLGDLSYDLAQDTFLLRDKSIALAKRESLLLRKLFFNQDQFTSRSEVAKFLLKDCYMTNSNLIDVYVYRLRKLLRQHDSTLKIKYHSHLGYKITHCNSP